MTEKHCFLCALILLIIVVSNATAICLDSPEPEFSTTFLSGFWYEHLSTSTLLNNNTCSHFDITCNTTTCIISHVIWESYCLQEIWNGTIKNTDNNLELVINGENASDTKTYPIGLRFQDDAVLIWSNTSNTNTVFASVLVRIDDENDMEKVWNKASQNMNYLSIVEECPAGMWTKVNTTECPNKVGSIYQHSYPNLILVLLFVIAFDKILL